MWISEIKLNNFRSFANADINLSQGINLIVGSNNSGKSTLLRSILWIQQGFGLQNTDLRILQETGTVTLKLNNAEPYFLNFFSAIESAFLLEFLLSKNDVITTIKSIGNDTLRKTNNNYDSNNSYISNTEPHNCIYPYLSKRKVGDFSELINLGTASSVIGNFSYLYSKIDRISNPQIPAYQQYTKACEEILGFQIASTPSPNGKKAAYIVNNYENISLASMGEGVSNLVGLIVDLCMAQNKIFLIEEPENDVHPQALKKLLKLIIEKSEINQFIITTHSNIVTKYLGSQPESKLFQVTMEFENRIPTSNVQEIPPKPEAKRKVLEDLGYDFFDVELWSAWLILEESSAERIIRDYLIPWFVPDLKDKLRTFSARSVSEVETKFEDFNKLFVFLHLQPIYKNLAWVIIDGGEEEAKIIEKMKTNYAGSGWNKEQFLQLSQHDFERYYPKQFEEQVNLILKQDKKTKRQSKQKLFDEVKNWLDENHEEAKIALERSASEVIDLLKQINSSLSSR
jgi:predicted ATPase